MKQITGPSLAFLDGRFVNVPGDTMTGPLVIDGFGAAEVGLTISLAPSQTANGFVITDSSANVLSGTDSNGLLFSYADTSPTNFLAAGAGNTTMSGTNNVAIGNEAMLSITTAAGNIAIGHQAMRALTGGNGANVALGDFAMNAAGSNTTNNMAIGSYSLQNTTGSQNTGIGTRSLSAQTSGVENIGIGYEAGRYNVKGDYNTWIGTQAGRGATANNSSNIGIGHSSGYSITTGSSNIFLGYMSGYRQTTLSNLLIIDNQQRADAATELTNSILYGVMAATPAAQTLRINADILGSVGAKIGDGGTTNYLNISNTGVVTLLGSAKRWLAIRPDLDYTVITAQGKPTQVVVGVFHGYSMPVYNNDNEELFFNIHVPGRWDEVSNPVVHLLVALAGAEDVSDNFKFQISWEHLTEEDVIPVTSHDVEVEQAVLTGRGAQYSTYELQFTIDYDVDDPDNLADHDDLAFRLRRIDATNPDITNEVIILDYHVEFQVDKMFDGDAV